MTELKIYGLIPVKSFSKRFPEKNFSEFCDTNLIQNTIDKLIKSKIDKIYISTDNIEKVLEYTDKHTTIIKRHTHESPEKPETPLDEVVMDFIKQLDIKDNYIIALCQVTSPNWSYHRLTYAIHRLEQFNKTVISVSPNFQPNGCFYIFTKEMFLEYQRIYHHDNGIYLVVLPWDESIDIDYLHQLPIAEAIVKEQCDDL